jgi:formylmethanofuran dehydrogenase subunit B
MVEASVELGFVSGSLSTELNFATYNGLLTTEQADDLFVMADDAATHFAFSCAENVS